MRSSRATRKSAVLDLAEALRQGVELEDCRTLEVHTYSGPGVMALGLPPVAAAHAGYPAYSAEVGLEPLE